MNEKISFLKKFFLYTQERFPIPGAFVYSGAIFYLSYFFPNKIAGGLGFNLVHSILGLFTAFFILLHLRLLDEHKDYDKDLKAHPDRMLSQGKITLKDLRIVLWIVLALEIGINLFLGVKVFLFYGIVLVWSLLMFKEFFAPGFLNRHMTLYLVSHQLLVPLVVLYGIASRMDILALSQAQLLQVLLFFIAVMSLTITYEVARKTWSQDREHEAADSYTKFWGRPKTFIVTQLMALLGGGLLFYFYGLFALSPVFIMVLAGFYLIFLVAQLKFLNSPTHKNSKLVELTGMVYVFAAFVNSAVGFY